MSGERVRDFLGRLTSDEALGKQADDAYVSALLEVAKGAGYAVSEEDLRSALDESAASIPDAALDQVAGGLTFNTATGGANFNSASNFNTANNLLGGFTGFSQNGFSK